MSKWDKLIVKTKNLSKDIRFTELQKVLEEYGYKMYSPKSGTSHVTFRKPGESKIITIPRNTPVKVVYVLMVKKVILEEEKNGNTNVYEVTI